ncbi:hypothetical protein C2E23DRAFT_719904 [Lenzites betulinus]|nr:hypothetical protein C2E23DRAFT_719904 [Lenzites betulinus]
MGWQVRTCVIDALCSNSTSRTHRSPRALLDKAGRVFAVLAGAPRDDVGWKQVNEDVQKLFDGVRSSYKFNPKNTSHRRGDYTAITAGISYGGGQVRPGNLVHTSPPIAAADELLSHPAIQRLAGFGDSAFKLYAPRLHEYYASTMDTLLKRDGMLEPNFNKSAFAAATFNLGPQVATHVHIDHQNLPAGWCTVTAIGDFNPKLGGHILLWDLKLMIEFPPGALILIPSAILRHSNTVIGSGERRYSFTQFSAGGLFRWVECGFQTQKMFKDAGGVFSMTGSERWLRGVEMWSTWEELRASAEL